jgi:hypothetical protein
MAIILRSGSFDDVGRQSREGQPRSQATDAAGSYESGRECRAAAMVSSHMRACMRVLSQLSLRQLCVRVPPRLARTLSTMDRRRSWANLQWRGSTRHV